MALDLGAVHDFLVDVAKQAGKTILAANPQVESAATKSNSTDLVTETDRAVEGGIRESLHERYSDIAFYGEESYVPGSRLTDAPTFVCDPIDGTVNFVHGFPWGSEGFIRRCGNCPVTPPTSPPWTKAT